MSHRHKVTALGKLIIYALRHRPDEFGLVPDREGYVSLRELQQAIAEEKGWSYVRRSDIMEVAHTTARGLLDVVDNRIRVCLADDSAPTINADPTAPPALLFHATTRKRYPHILRHGLHPTASEYVYLTTDRDLAMRRGRRRDPNPVLLEVRAREAWDMGILFYHSYPLSYLTEFVPPDVIHGPPVAAVMPDPVRLTKTIQPKVRDITPGSVLLDLAMGPFPKKDRARSRRDRSKKHRRTKRHT
jgi:putative RNA 2'-phosphotransferase